jgi:DNA-directed RNA polymerase specialized sigma24 family protein
MSFTITPKQRVAIDAKSAGMTRADIAAQLRVTKQAVKKLWARARKSARKQLPPELREFYDQGVYQNPQTVKAVQLSLLRQV